MDENNADDNSYNPILSERNGSPPKDANDDTNNNNNNNNKATLPTSDDDDKCESKLFDIYNHVQSFADAKVQVEKDLPRTFPAHPLLEGVGRDALRRVLLAYARYNPKVGYCQGLNFLAGLLLLLMPEESAFYVLDNRGYLARIFRHEANARAFGGSEDLESIRQSKVADAFRKAR